MQGVTEIPKLTKLKLFFRALVCVDGFVGKDSFRYLKIEDKKLICRNKDSTSFFVIRNYINVDKGHSSI